jgi:hypothetical protein
MILILLMFLGVLVALGSYWLAWWVLLTQAFTFTSWAGLGLAVAIYSANRAFVALLKMQIDRMK